MQFFRNQKEQVEVQSTTNKMRTFSIYLFL